jgi:hypothetical protein
MGSSDGLVRLRLLAADPGREPCVSVDQRARATAQPQLMVVLIYCFQRYKRILVFTGLSIQFMLPFQDELE